MSEQNKALSKRNIDEVWNQRKLAVIDELVAPNSVLHDPTVPGGKVSGSQGYRQFVEIYLAAFPDLHFTIQDQFADGDKVATRWTGSGTQTGALMGIAPTGKRSTVTGITIDRYQNGKAVESWVNYDALGMFQQLGVIPMLASAGAKA
jgi:predicted ester cyclase